MLKRFSSKISYHLPQIVALLFILAFAVFAWQEPSQAPPGGNAPAPLNVGPTGQSKEGGLILNTGNATTGLIVDKGRVGIGTTIPAKLLHIFGGLFGNDAYPVKIDRPVSGPSKKISMEFAYNGTGVWEIGNDLSGDGTNNFFFWNPTSYGTMFLTPSGRVGIGTTTPGEKLDVQGGNVKVGTVIIKGDGSISANLNAERLGGYTAGQLTPGLMTGFSPIPQPL